LKDTYNFWLIEVMVKIQSMQKKCVTIFTQNFILLHCFGVNNLEVTNTVKLSSRHPVITF